MRAERDGAPTADGGFTLLEMLVVLAILGVAGGIVLMRGPPRSAGLEMRLQTDALAQTLRLARTQAMARNQAVTVMFDAASALVRVEDGAGGIGPAYRLPVGFAAAVTLASDQSAGVRGAILFMPDGSATGDFVAGIGLMVLQAWST